MTEATARRFWPGLDPIGQTIETPVSNVETVTREVVGIARDTQIERIGEVPSTCAKRTMRPVVIGAVVGVAAAVGVSQILSSVLFGVSPVDPIALLGAVLIVAAVALAAGGLPARRAARIDPNQTLHYRRGPSRPEASPFRHRKDGKRRISSSLRLVVPD